MTKRKSIYSLSLAMTLALSSLAGTSASALNKDGSDSSSREAANAAISRQAATQGMVLLKNQDSVLPLKGTAKNKLDIAVFGVGQFLTVKGGTGSGDVNNISTVNIYQGLKNNSSLKVDEGLASIYKKWADENKVVPANWFESVPSNPELPLSSSGISLSEVASRNDAAVIVISRNSGEGSDRTATKGDYYLQDAEKAMIDAVSKSFDKVVLILNVGGIIDTKFINSKIDSVLYASLPGQEAGNAIADVLTGAVTPSGKLTDTWAVNYRDYSSSDNFGNANKNGNMTANSWTGQLEQQASINYEEGIYVGYRYFDTFGVKPAYPFGYGLSYANFDIKNTKLSVSGDTATITAKVTNNSKQYSGKEVVQVYFSSPEGDLEKPYQELAAYDKTGEISPKGSETVTIKFPLSDMASYDEDQAAYVLEKGYYYIRVGNSSRNTSIAGAVYVPSDIKTEVLANKVEPMKEEVTANDFTLLSNSGATPYTYAREQAEKKAAEAKAAKIKAASIPVKYANYSGQTMNPAALAANGSGYKLSDVAAGKVSMEQFVAQLSVQELANLVSGIGWGGFGIGSTANDGSMLGSSSSNVPGAAGQSTDGLLEKYGIPAIVLSDGPAGIRITQSVKDANGKELYTQNATAFPVGTLLASSWDPEVLKTVGKAVGTEMLEYDVDLWLAPGMNIHRNPLNGRNFEYYSEDPLVTGTIAAAVTQGVQSKGVGVTIKHYAANNQETDRTNSDSVVMERTLREIYLKGFEIAVKNSHPYSIMTSYNDINGVPSAENFEMINDIARSEWGFNGFVMTDWGGGISKPALSMYAGNDMIQPGGIDTIKAIIEAVNSGQVVTSNGIAKEKSVITTGMLQRSAANILKVVLKTPAFKELQ